MRPPVTIESLTEEWLQDSSVNVTDPDIELAKIPNLHAKYLNILTHHNLIVKKLSFQYTELKRVKTEYYNGDLNNPEDLETYGLQPMMKKILKPQLQIYIDSDSDLNKILMKKVIHQEIVDFCTQVLKELNSRTYQLGNIIKWKMFTNGV